MAEAIVVPWKSGEINHNNAVLADKVIVYPLHVKTTTSNIESATAIVAVCLAIIFPIFAGNRHSQSHGSALIYSFHVKSFRFDWCVAHLTVGLPTTFASSF